MSSLPIDHTRYEEFGRGKFHLINIYGCDLRTISAFATEELISELEKRRLSDAND